MIDLNISTQLTNAYRNVSLAEMDAAALTFAIDLETRGVLDDTSMLHDAMALAAAVHLRQSRPARSGTGTDPYVTHPFRNVLRLIRYGCADTVVLAATALHDAVEDQADRIVAVLGGEEEPSADKALTLLARHFTTEVADIVGAVTNPAKPAELSPSEKNKVYRDHVAAVIQEPRVFLVKVSDFIDNAGSLSSLNDAAKRDKLRLKYAPLVPVFVDARAHLGEALALSEDGYALLDGRLTRLAESLA